MRKYRINVSFVCAVCPPVLGGFGLIAWSNGCWQVAIVLGLSAAVLFGQGVQQIWRAK